MKRLYTLFTLLLFVNVNYAQLPGLLPFSATDSIYVKGKAYSVDIINDIQGVLEYYINGDDTKTLRSIDKNKLDRYVNHDKRDRNVSVLDPEPLKGKSLLVQVSPFNPSLSKFWQVVVDDGVNGNYLLTDKSGGKIKFFSEMAIVNYFIGLGWELHKIQLIEKGSIGGASSFLESAAIGGSVNISSNVYFFKALYKGVN